MDYMYSSWYFSSFNFCLFLGSTICGVRVAWGEVKAKGGDVNDDDLPIRRVIYSTLKFKQNK